MARNQYSGVCYQCGLMVEPGTGHFERHNGGWRTKHANYPGHGRVTCAAARAERYSRRTEALSQTKEGA
jgi:hypothetical protein